MALLNIGIVPVNLKERDAFHLTIEEYLLALVSLIEELVRTYSPEKKSLTNNTHSPDSHATPSPWANSGGRCKSASSSRTCMPAFRFSISKTTRCGSAAMGSSIGLRTWRMWCTILV